jgi:ABC-2 type transport system permease protein
LSFAIQTHSLTKRFPKPGRLGGLTHPFVKEEGTLAVDRVNVKVKCGEIFGLVGPNGAGKTTLVKMLSTLILPTSGSARIKGYDLTDEGAIKASIGLVTGNERSFYQRLSCRENLRFYAGLHNLSSSQAEQRIGELSRLLGLDEFLDKRFDTCSTGMKHRLALARGLLNDHELLFLDEPTRSLDPLAAARFREAVYALAHHEGCTVFLVTHDLDEAAELCDCVGVMLQGQVRVVDAPQNLRRLIGPQERCNLNIRGFTSQIAEQLLRLGDVLSLTERETAVGVTVVELQLRDRKAGLPAALRVVGEGGGTVDGLEFEAASWDEVFQRLVDAREGEATAREAAPPMVVGMATPVTSEPSPDNDGDEGASMIRLSLPQFQQEREAGRASSRDGILGILYKPLLFLRRDLKTQVSYRLSFILQFLGILFSSASFYFVAQLFGAGVAPHLGSYGGDYFSFVLIGIAFAGYQSIALYTFSGVIQSAQMVGTLEAMLVTPTRLSVILLSSSLWNFAFTSLRVIVYLLAGTAIFGVDLRGANVLAAFIVLCLTILALSGIGILSACFIMVFKRGNPVNFLISSLSTLLGGVYYPIDVLPSWLQTLARLFPLTYSLEAMRRALLLGNSLVDLAQEVLILAFFSAVLIPLSLLAFRYAVQQARRDGSLTQF